MRMLTDNPVANIDDDRFGFASYAKILADTIIDTNDLPFCIGVFGAWGTGKTSLMLLIQSVINKHEKTKTIWFNPWKYDKKEALWNALIQSILYRIADGSKTQKVKTKAKQLAKSTTWLLLKKGITTATIGTISEDSLEKLKNIIVKENEIHYRHINQFEKDFEEVVNSYTKGGKLIVFIDDLDRCLPENAITVLESLKLFIGNASCVFVLGMDHHIVEEGIKYRFGERINMSGKDYLDKIIQVPFFLPPVPASRLRSAFQVAKTADYSETVWRLVELGLDCNPRNTKRFVNCFYLLKEILKSRSNNNETTADDTILSASDREMQDFYLAKLLILQMAFTEFYSVLKLNPDAWHFFETRLLKASSLDKLQEASNERPNLAKFWQNEYFKSFMEKTSFGREKSFVVPPSETTVSSLLQAINLVSSDNKAAFQKLE